MLRKINFFLFSSFFFIYVNVFANEKVAFINNPLKDSKIESLSDLFKVVIDGLVVVATPLIVLVFIYAGFKFVSAQGDPTKIQEAKDIFISTVIAALIILSAQLIIDVITNTAGDLLS